MNTWFSRVIPILLVLLLGRIASSYDISPEAAKLIIRERRNYWHRNGLRGAVYAMSNNLETNTIIAYVRNALDEFTFIGEFDTGGRGGVLDDSDNVDPLLSQNSVVVTPNRKFLLNVNAGSNTVTVFRILRDFKLKRMSVTRVTGTGPVAIAVNRRKLVYVASADLDGKFDSFVDSKGSVSGFRLTYHGKLIPLLGSVRKLPTRPADVAFSPDGRSVVVSSLNAFLGALPTPSASLLSFKLFLNGRLSAKPVDTASSTTPGSPPGRNPPALIGIAVVRVRGVQYVVAPEIRGEQAGSVSSFRLDRWGKLTPVQIDLVIGSSITEGQVAPCWIKFTSRKNIFFITNTGSDSVSSLSFSRVQSTLISEVAASGQSSLEAPIDLAISSDDKFLFVHAGKQGEVGIFKIGPNASLQFVKNLRALPTGNTQGVAAI